MDQLPPPFGGDYFNNYAPLVIVVLCGCTYAIGCAPLRARLRAQLHSQFAPTSVARTCPAGTLTSVRACSRAVPSVSRAWPAPARPSLSTRISRTRASITAPPSWSRRRRRSPTECVWAPSPRRRVLTLIAMDLPWTCHRPAILLPSYCHRLPSAAILLPFEFQIDRRLHACRPQSHAHSATPGGLYAHGGCPLSVPLSPLHRCPSAPTCSFSRAPRATLKRPRARATVRARPHARGSTAFRTSTSRTRRGRAPRPAPPCGILAAC